MKHIFIIGSRGIPAQYGGFETFVEELVNHQKSPLIQYHVACLSDTKHQEHFSYKSADCFYINPLKLGPARVIAYDISAINYALSYIKKQKISQPIFYILGNTIGAFISHYVRKIHRIGGQVFVNPDGLEWKRSKWSRPVQYYLKYAEKKMANKADLIISDNEGIENYIKNQYVKAKTTYIAYGTDIENSSLDKTDQQVRAFFSKWDIKENQYALIVGRFVPENNYDKMIEQFMKTKVKKDLVIITNYDKTSAFFEQLKQERQFDKDKRIKFVGTVYDKELLKYIRENAFLYLHGHEVGGTNPGLLEALAHTKYNLVLDVDFNRKVAQDTVYYWNKNDDSLSNLITHMDKKSEELMLKNSPQVRVKENYTWSKIVSQYEELFLNEN